MLKNIGLRLWVGNVNEDHGDFHIGFPLGVGKRIFDKFDFCIVL